jgi:hypothetical protein
MRGAASGAVETDFVVWSVEEAGASVGVGGVRTWWEAQGARGSGQGVGGADNDDEEEEKTRGDGRRPRPPLWEV